MEACEPFCTLQSILCRFILRKLDLSSVSSSDDVVFMVSLRRISTGRHSFSRRFIIPKHNFPYQGVYDSESEIVVVISKIHFEKTSGKKMIILATFISTLPMGPGVLNVHSKYYYYLGSSPTAVWRSKNSSNTSPIPW